jgi:cell wall assembly regulator SMI1
MAFCSFEQSVQAYSVLTQLQLSDDFEWHEWWNVGWFPVLHGPSGDYLCVDSVGTFGGAPGQLIEFVHNDASRNIIAPSLSAWLESYCDLLDADLLDHDGCLISSDEFVWVQNIQGFPLARSASQRTPGN